MLSYSKLMNKSGFILSKLCMAFIDTDWKYFIFSILPKLVVAPKGKGSLGAFPDVLSKDVYTETFHLFQSIRTRKLISCPSVPDLMRSTHEIPQIVPEKEF